MLDSHLQVLQQAIDYLDSISNKNYTHCQKPTFISSAGEHIRHILDHYLALLESDSSGTIDYNKRNRGNNCETDPECAKSICLNIISWLESIDTNSLNSPLTVLTEINIKKTFSVEVESTMARELIFVSSHAIHHFAMIAIISKSQEHSTHFQFGIAPATATHFRDKACAP